MRKIFTLVIFIVLLISISCNIQKKSPLQIEVSVADSLYSKPISGKILVLFHKDTNAQLIWGPNPFNPQPFYRIDFKNWDTKEPLTIDKFNNWWTNPIDSLNGIYAMQLVVDCDNTERDYLAEGNSYSKKQTIKFNNENINIAVKVEKETPFWEFEESQFIKEELFQSNSLTSFWKSPMYIKAGVVLPESYFIETEKEFSVVYVFPGFASHHATVSVHKGQINRYGMNTVGDDKIFVFCNGEFHQGYHHFADSENNGPWGQAFTEEFIQYIESKYRIKKNKRFLIGQSSGAWTSIWLQVNYPELFESAFAGAPDPIDFRAMGNNIYRKNANFYISNKTDSTSLKNSEFNKQWALMEETINEYNQFKTWESTYSQKNKKGNHFQLFDRETGEIYPEIAEQWKKYDISLIIQSDPDYYREKLKGKIHIFVSNDDDYGLDESIRLYKDIVDSLNFKSDIQFLNGLGHNVWTDDLRKHIHEIIDNKK